MVHELTLPGESLLRFSNKELKIESQAVQISIDPSLSRYVYVSVICMTQKVLTKQTKYQVPTDDKCALTRFASVPLGELEIL